MYKGRNQRKKNDTSNNACLRLFPQDVLHSEVGRVRPNLTLLTGYGNSSWGMYIYVYICIYLEQRKVPWQLPPVAEGKIFGQKLGEKFCFKKIERCQMLLKLVCRHWNF